MMFSGSRISNLELLLGWQHRDGRAGVRRQVSGVRCQVLCMQLGVRSETVRHLLLRKRQSATSGPMSPHGRCYCKKKLTFSCILLRFHSWTPLEHRKRRWDWRCRN